MYALHLAMNALRAGDCDSAIVASANWIADPGVQIALDKLGALSGSSRCHTFDARASGYARGEGYGAIYLKRLPLALSDGAPIRAVIRGTSINSNGRTGGITRPSASGQENVILDAYRNAGGLDFADTSYFECHGTGTYVGDPIEVAAVGRVFAPSRETDDPLLIGSVKSNIGHGEGASALASIMKVVLSLENGLIPPVFDLQTRNPNIDFTGAKVVPVTEPTAWPSSRLKRASINSFGYGGANGHCIIDHVENVLPGYTANRPFQLIREPETMNGASVAHPEIYSNGHADGILNGTLNGKTNGYDKDQRNAHSATMSHSPVLKIPAKVASRDAPTSQFVLLPLSSHNESSFDANLGALAKGSNNVPLADLAYTLSARRSKLPFRSFCLVNKDQVASSMKLERKTVRAPLQPPNIGFVFTGQGAQWYGMGRELFEHGVFASTITFLEQVLHLLPSAPSWSILDILSGSSADESVVQNAEVSQTVCTAVQVGLVDLLASWNVRPKAVCGHSSGEIGAAYAAGRVTAAEAIVAAFLRGAAVSGNTADGSMLAVGLGSDAVQAYIKGREATVNVAAINSPASVTLSGDAPVIADIAARMTADSVFNRILKTGGNAYHSHHMLPIGEQYSSLLSDGLQCIQAAGLSDASLRYPAIAWTSSVTPAKDTSDISDFVSYWRENLQSPVLFPDALLGMVKVTEAPISTVIELGPHPALKGPIDQTLKAANHAAEYISTLKRQEDGRISLLRCVGTLFTLNAAIDLAAVNSVDTASGLVHGVVSTSLPPYRYTYGGLNYHESRPSKEYRYRSVLRHDILGSKLVGTAQLRPQWRNILRVKDVPWLADHRLGPGER
jgi:acyl transferase domain-containing protein